MYSLERGKLAVETLIEFDHSRAGAVAEPGCPNRHSPYNRWRDYREHGEVRPGEPIRQPKSAPEMKQAAAERHLEHGRGPARTMRAPGYPKSREHPAPWMGGLAPGRGKGGPATGPRREEISLEEKIQAVAEPEGRDGTAAEVAARRGAAREMPYARRGQPPLGGNPDEDGPAKDGGSASERFDKPPASEAGPTQTALEPRAEVRGPQIGLGVRGATLEIVKRTRAPTRTG